jgi:hypothetical protein
VSGPRTIGGPVGAASLPAGRWWASLALILGGALALRLGFFGGLRGWDDIEYIEAARGLLAGDLAPHSVFWTRYGLVVPLAVTRAWLGPGELAAELVPLVYSLAEIGLAGALGLLYGGMAVGLTAAALLAVVPLAVMAASDLHTDLPLAVFWASTIYAVKRGEAEGSRRRLWLVGAGLALGAAYLTKEVALALVVVLGLRLLWSRRGLRGYGMLAGALAAVVLADGLWFQAVAGVPWLRYSPSLARLHAESVLLDPPGHAWMLGYARALLDPLDGSFGYFGGLFFLVAAASVWGLRRRDGRMRELVIWWAPVLLLFNFAPLDRSFGRPLFYHFARTLHPLLVPFVLAVALWLVEARWGRPWQRALVVAGFGMLAAAGIWTTHFDSRAWAAAARQVALIVGREPASTVVASDVTNRALLRTLLPDRRDRIVWYGEHPIGSLPRGSLVLGDPVFLATDRQRGRAVPDALLSPPGDWEEVAEFFRPRRQSLRALGLGWVGRPPAAPSGLSAEPVVLWRLRGRGNEGAPATSVGAGGG